MSNGPQGEQEATVLRDAIQGEVDAEGRRWCPTLDAGGRVQRFDVYEAEIFRFALANAGGCVSRAAEMLGVGRATMYRKMRAYEIVAPPVSQRAIERSRKARPDEDQAA